MSVLLEGAAGRRIREDKILRFLVEGTVSETGSDFFRALARQPQRGAANLRRRPGDEAQVKSLHVEPAGGQQTRVRTAGEIEELGKNNLILALEKGEWKISGPRASPLWVSHRRPSLPG
jgi:hypothetical protein